MSREVVFFFRNDAEGGDRWINYLSVDERDSGIGHGIYITGSCFSGRGLNDVKSKDITTFLKKSEFKALQNFDAEMSKLGYSSSIKENPEKMAKATELYNEIAPIIEKLKSEENQKFFDNKILPEEIEAMKDEFSFSDDEVQEVFNNYYQGYRDRSIVGSVFDNVEDLGREEADSLGVLSDDRYDIYFDYEQFGKDLLNDDEYFELKDGRVVMLMY